MWIFRIVYLEKKEEEYDSLEIFTIRMYGHLLVQEHMTFKYAYYPNR